MAVLGSMAFGAHMLRVTGEEPAGQSGRSTLWLERIAGGGVAVFALLLLIDLARAL
jgi:hypothetical protein